MLVSMLQNRNTYALLVEMKINTPLQKAEWRFLKNLKIGMEKWPKQCVHMWINEQQKEEVYFKYKFIKVFHDSLKKKT
jgi:hypothetical protein